MYFIGGIDMTEKIINAIIAEQILEQNFKNFPLNIKGFPHTGQIGCCSILLYILYKVFRNLINEQHQ